MQSHACATVDRRLDKIEQNLESVLDALKGISTKLDRQQSTNLSVGMTTTRGHIPLSSRRCDPMMTPHTFDAKPQVSARDKSSLMKVEDINELQSFQMQKRGPQSFLRWIRRIIFLPDSRPRTIFNFIFLIVIFYEWASIILGVAARRWETPQEPLVTAIDVCCGLFYLLDIYMNMHTAIISGGVIVDEDLKVIWEHYRRHWFWFDATITTIAFANLILMMALPTAIYRIIDLARCIRIVRIFFIFKDSNPLKIKSKTVVALQFVFFLCIGVHILSCLWIMCTITYADGVTLDNSHLLEFYYSSAYWAVTTLATVGYGDIVPVNGSSRAVAMMAELMAIMTTSFSIAWLGSRLTKVDEFERLRTERKEKLASLMDHYSIPWTLQKEVFTIFPPLLESTLSSNLESLELLPNYLQTKIKKFIKVKLIRNVPLFQGAKENVLLYLAQHMRHIISAPGDVIVSAGAVSHSMFFLEQGVVEVVVDDPETETEVLQTTLTDGSWFGEVGLLVDTMRSATVRSATMCSVFELKKEGFQNALELFPEFEQLMESKLTGEMDDGAHSIEGATAKRPNCADMSRRISELNLKSARLGHKYAPNHFQDAPHNVIPWTAAVDRSMAMPPLRTHNNADEEGSEALNSPQGSTAGFITSPPGGPIPAVDSQISSTRSIPNLNLHTSRSKWKIGKFDAVRYLMKKSQSRGDIPGTSSTVSSLTHITSPTHDANTPKSVSGIIPVIQTPTSSTTYRQSGRSVIEITPTSPTFPVPTLMLPKNNGAKLKPYRKPSVSESFVSSTDQGSDPEAEGHDGEPCKVESLTHLPIDDDEPVSHEQHHPISSHPPNPPKPIADAYPPSPPPPPPPPLVYGARPPPMILNQFLSPTQSMPLPNQYNPPNVLPGLISAHPSHPPPILPHPSSMGWLQDLSTTLSNPTEPKVVTQGLSEKRPRPTSAHRENGQAAALNPSLGAAMGDDETGVTRLQSVFSSSFVDDSGIPNTPLNSFR